MVFRRLLIILLLGFVPALTNAAATPEAWQGLTASAYTQLDEKVFLRTDQQINIILNGDETLIFDVSSQSLHSNGDISINGLTRDGRATINATFGRFNGLESVFGHIHQDGKDYLLNTDQSGRWAIELPASGVSYNSCGVEAHADFQLKTATQSSTSSLKVTAADDVLDILMTYNRAFAERYPDELLETRINHFTQIANQSLVNSDISLLVRVVGIEFFDYRNDNTNSDLLVDMANTLRGNTAPGLNGLRTLRDQRGADLVIMFRPHDIETRGSCGIAFFPNDDPSLGVNVVSDGMSSWSVCLDDVMTHEIGHNLGAGHQVGAGGGVFSPLSAAFIRPGQYSTMMGSFGTGRPDRFRGLPLFSNPDVQCGGQPCGSNNPANAANNAAVIKNLIPAVTAYRLAISNAPEPLQPDPSFDDSDGDGVIDWDDHFPFDPSEQSDADLDGHGDQLDAFPGDPSENLDSDNDLIGDNADDDDDNDLVADSEDRFPTDFEEFADSDNDGIGNNADAFPQNASEFSDFDQDGIGDNQDNDDDGDGFPELHPDAQDLLVISVGNNRVLRFDTSRTAFRGVEIMPDDGLLTFQSDLDYRNSDQTLLYTSASAVRRLNLLNRETLGIYVPAYAQQGITQLGTGFPTAVTSFSNGARFATTLMDNRSVSLFSGHERVLAAPALSWRLSADESPIDIISLGDEAIILGQASRSIYLTNGQGVDFLSEPGTAWMQDPHRMVLSGDGRLLISDQGRNSVVAVDLQTGAFRGDFVRLSEQGYSNPTGVAVTNDRQLLVASATDNVILSYDLDSGVFNGELVSRGLGGLSQPHAIAVVPQWLDRFGQDPDRVIRPNGGLWFDPATNGRGFDIEVFNHLLSVIWYTYDDDGNPLWYISAGELNGFHYEAALKLTRLTEDGGFISAEVGSLTLDFKSERTANMSWIIDERGGRQSAGSESLQWIRFDSEPAASDHTGIWSRADGPGWGVTLTSQGTRSVAIAYLYDSDGRPRWVISNPAEESTSLRFSMKTAFSTSLCPACSGVSDFSFVAAGEMTLELKANNRWSSSIVFPSPLTGNWHEDQTAIIRLSEDPQRPR